MQATMTPFKPHPRHAARSIAGAYTSVQAHTGVNGASAHELVSMLFDGLHQALTQARGAIQRGDVASKCSALSRAARIVDEGLKASLNRQDGGELAENLHAVYSYIGVTLTKANLKGDEALVMEVINLIQPLREAWGLIGQSKESN